MAEKNKPIVTENIDTTVTTGSTNLITSGAVASYVDGQIATAITTAIEGSY